MLKFGDLKEKHKQDKQLPNLFFQNIAQINRFLMYFVFNLSKSSAVWGSKIIDLW